jgi:hypothetical protein
LRGTADHQYDRTSWYKLSLAAKVRASSNKID